MGNRFYIIRKRSEHSTEVWVSADSVAHAFDNAGQPYGAEWSSVYATSPSGALARAMGTKVRLKWRAYSATNGSV